MRETSWSLPDGEVFLWSESQVDRDRFDGRQLKLGEFLDGRAHQTQDTKWQNASSKRDVTYATLPSRYRLGLQEGNKSDVWSGTVVPVTPLDQPAWYQTTWFCLFCTIGAFALLWHVCRIRLRAVTMKVHDLMAERLMEREHIAAEIHDTLLQRAQGLILLFSGVAAQLPGDSSDSAEAAIEHTEHLLQKVRDCVCDLPPRPRDLPECFRNLRHEFEGSATKYQFTQVGGQPELQLTVDNEVYELGREAVRNAAQHAKACEVSVHLSFLPYALQMTVSDDGVGIDADTIRRGRIGHRGLQGMTRRAHKLHGNCLVQSKTGTGTIVRLSVPASMAYRNGTPTISALLESYWQVIRRKLSSSKPT